MIDPTTIPFTPQTPPPGTVVGGTTRETKTNVDYQSFLKLLVAEMKHQDPTSPMESRDYVAQLATFSQVEQSIQSNRKLDQILQASALAQAGSIIGRTVTSADGATSGVVQEVKLTADGITAIIEDDVEIPMTSGVTVKWAMNEADALDLVQYAIWTVIVASAPAVIAAMLVGIGIALIQALTQIQEITLTFVPKIVAILVVVSLSGPFIGGQISAFTSTIFERIETGF